MRLGGEAGVAGDDARPKPHATEGVTPALCRRHFGLRWMIFSPPLCAPMSTGPPSPQSYVRGTLEMVCARSGGLTGNPQPGGACPIAAFEGTGEPTVRKPSFAATDHVMAMTLPAHDRAVCRLALPLSKLDHRSADCDGGQT